MKYYLKALTALSIFSLLISSCQQQPRNENRKEEVPAKEVTAPKQIISTKEAQALYQNYSKNRAPLIEAYEAKRVPEEKFNVARYTTYDYKTIKQYLAFIEQEAAKANVEISSLRFYFANYPNLTNFEDGSKIRHPRQNSIFIVPTLNKDGQDFGFFTTADGNGRKAVLLRGVTKPNTSGLGLLQQKTHKNYAGFNLNFSVTPPLFQGDQSLIMNRGGSVPPPHTLGDF